MKTALSVALALLAVQCYCHAQTYYVSAAGNDTWPGTSPDSAFQTLTPVNSLFLSAGDSVLLRRGDVFRGYFTVNQPGASGNPIVISAYGSGNDPVISGAKQLTGWSSSGDTFTVSLTETAYNFFINDEERTLARFPNSGYMTVDSSDSTLGIWDAALTQPAGYWNGAQMCVHTAQWCWEKPRAASYTPGYVSYAAMPVMPLAAIAQYGYFFFDFAPELDTAFEWHYDSTANALTYIAQPGENPDTEMCEATVYSYGIMLGNSARYVKVENIRFEKQYNAGLLFMPGSRRDTIQNCAFNRQYKYGVSLSGSFHELTGCSFRGVDGLGIYHVNGSSSEIHHNIFRAIGQYRASGIGQQINFSAIKCAFTDSMYIHHNDIDSAGYCGVSADGTYHVVEKNVARNCMMMVNDGGPFKSYGAASQYNIFRHNFASASSGNMEGTFHANFQTPAFYFDYNVNHCVIENNTVWDQDPKGIFLNGGNNNNRITGNVVYGCRYSIDLNGASQPTPIYNDTVKHNVFFALDTSNIVMRQTDISPFTFTFGDIDSNYYFNPYSNAHIAFRVTSGGPVNYSFEDWQTSSGFDLNSKKSFVNWSPGVNESRLFINPSDTVVTYMLPDTLWLDLDSVPVCGSLTLDPWTSQILIRTTSLCAASSQQPESALSFELYPNPANDFVYVATEPFSGQKGEVKVFSLAGAELFRAELNPRITELDLSGLPAGMYLVQVSTEYSSASRRLVRQ